MIGQNFYMWVVNRAVVKLKQTSLEFTDAIDDLFAEYIPKINVIVPISLKNLASHASRSSVARNAAAHISIGKLAQNNPSPSSLTLDIQSLSQI